MSAAVIPEETGIWLLAMAVEVLVGFRLAVGEHLLGFSYIDGHLEVFVGYQIHGLFDTNVLHIDDDEELLNVECPVTHIFGVEANEVGACDVDAALGEHPFLIGDVGSVLLQL